MLAEHTSHAAGRPDAQTPGLATDKTSPDAYRTAQGDAWMKNYLMSKSNTDLYNTQADPKGGKCGTGSRTFEPGSTTATLWATVAPE